MKLETGSVQDIQLFLNSEAIFEMVKLPMLALNSFNVAFVLVFGIAYFVSYTLPILLPIIGSICLYTAMMTWLAIQHKVSHHAALSRDNNHLLSESAIR